MERDMRSICFFYFYFSEEVSKGMYEVYDFAWNYQVSVSITKITLSPFLISRFLTVFCPVDALAPIYVVRRKHRSRSAASIVHGY